MITIAYWHLTKLPHLPWPHGHQISRANLCRIINKCLREGYTTMAIPHEEDITLYIGQGKLTQL
jgi:hypothetical protein